MLGILIVDCIFVVAVVSVIGEDDTRPLELDFPGILLMASFALAFFTIAALRFNKTKLSSEILQPSDGNNLTLDFTLYRFNGHRALILKLITFPENCD